MTGNWRTATVAELQRAGILLVEDGNHGEYRPRPDEFVGNGVAFIRAADMDSGRVLFQSASKINQRARQRITKGIGAPGDILLSHKGTVGKVAIVPDDAPPFVCSPQTTFWRTRDQQRLDRKYLYAFLRSPIFQAQLLTRAGETDMAPYVSLTSQRGLSVTLPPIDIQRGIAHILGTLDDKIELNHRMNETLEALARAIFKSWFVDFDPVHAKIEGRWRKGQALPGLPAHLYGLFPDRLTKSKLGEIPKGWEVTSLPELIEVNPFRALRKDEIAPYLDMASMPTKGHAAERVVERPFGSGMRFINGDTLVARITPCLENGKTAFVDFLSNGQVGWGSTEYIVLRPKASLPSEYAYCLAKSEGFREFAIQSMTGSSGRQRVPAESLSNLFLPAASGPVFVSFGRIVRPLFTRAALGIRECRTLAIMRDSLLPKLISGKMRVKGANQLSSEGQ
jgi:type I restriction enzyme S subunit